MRQRGARTNPKHSQLLATAAVLVSALGAWGCEGSISGDPSGPIGDPGGPGAPGGPAPGTPGGPEVTPEACAKAGPQAGPERIYRLTPEEYTHSLRVLRGDDTLEPELDADREPIATLDGVRKWYNAADAAVPSMASWLTTYGGCQASDATCAVTLYEAFAARAFRHPLKEDERAWLAESWAALPQAAAVELRLEVMAELILQAPQFLYLYAEGTPAGAVNALDGHERAQRLSYFLWDSLPDQALLTAAAAGELATPAGMRTQAQRMLADERAKPVLRAFLSEWLELDGATILPGLDDTPKDPELYSGFDEVLRASMRREIEAFMDWVMFEQDGSLDALFSGTRAYVNGPLAELYGVSGGPSGADEWSWVDLNTSQRAGMLTRAGFLAVHANQTATSPIRRGVYMLKEVLCVDLPSPPANVDNTPIEVTDDDVAGGVTTVRQATLERTGNPTCAGCHVMINELGFAFEHYDAVGRWQDAELSGGTIDASANLNNAGDELNGPVDGAIELSARLAKSPEVARCATEKWFNVALRRSPVDLDACSVQAIRGKVGQKPSIRELLLAIAESDAFLHVNHGGQ